MKPSEVDAVARAILEEVGKRLKAHAARLDLLEKILPGLEAKADSLERRASRHGQHLAKLETRMQAMERKA